MADVMLQGSSERRVLISGGCTTIPPPESLLCRLDQIDLRLRQLEEQQRHPAAAHHADDCDAAVRHAAPPAPQHQHTKSLPSALQHVQLRGALMDRLNLLESRIRQLSCELNLNPDAGRGSYAALGLGSTSSSVAAPRPSAEDIALSESAPMIEPCRDPPPVMMMRSAPLERSAAVAVAGGGSWSTMEILQTGARQLQGNKPNPSNNKERNLKEAKCACQKEKKKAEGNRATSRSRRWFGIGCS